MTEEYTMPKLGHLMEEGTIVRWAKDPGASIQKGEILLEVETDKAILQVESPFNGVLSEILVEVGKKVAVGVPIARYNANDL